MKVTPTDDLETCFALRRAVFMGEQGVTEEEEFDGLDDQALHFLVFKDDTPVGTARAFRKEHTLKIGRVCVSQDGRGGGYGKALMRGVMDWARNEGLTRAELDAQVPVIPFYEDLGFTAHGPEFDDAGIPHRVMDAPL